MTKPILLIEHVDQPKEERISRILAEEGHEFLWCNPSNGEALPENFDDFTAVIVYGGMEGAYDSYSYLKAELDWIKRWVDAGKPYLGICLGGQLLAKAMGGEAYADKLGQKEVGFHKVKSEVTDGLLGKLPDYFFQWHRDTFDLPKSATRLASSEKFQNQAFSLGAKVIGLQFHPEVTLEVAETWFRQFPGALKEPDMKSLPEIEAQFRQFDGSIESWTRSLLRKWLCCSRI
ncbi:type 1 glutamine amidotransferase [Kiloniella antarctica]|uniref:Type 1 glutamine amidotransferase n=1 Tax=Kiloniella antarctica TaxID=1550907 RepID=A0ABW5BNZ8_9PROT